MKFKKPLKNKLHNHLYTELNIKLYNRLCIQLHTQLFYQLNIQLFTQLDNQLDDEIQSAIKKINYTVIDLPLSALHGSSQGGARLKTSRKLGKFLIRIITSLIRMNISFLRK